MGGGSMISAVEDEHSTWAQPPAKFEAGTPAIAEAAGLGAAADYLGDLGMKAVRAHEREITAYALERLAAVEGLTDLRAARRGTSAAAWCPSPSRACTRTTSPRSAIATRSRSAPATTAPSH